MIFQNSSDREVLEYLYYIEQIKSETARRTFHRILLCFSESFPIFRVLKSWTGASFRFT